MLRTPVPQGLFPFTRDVFGNGGEKTVTARVVSKDRIPEPFTVSERYEVRGCSQGTDGARVNCCWIEGATHALLSDPFIRYFVIDYGAKVQLAGPRAFTRPSSLPADREEHYDAGALFMRVLSARYLLAGKLGQAAFDVQVERIYRDIRIRFGVAGDTMSDPEVLLGDALPGLRLFIALHWSGSSFQKQYLAYGCVPLVAVTHSCAGSAASGCRLLGRDSISYLSETLDTPLRDIDMTQAPWMIRVVRNGGLHSLADLLSRPTDDSLVRFSNQWRLSDITPVCGYSAVSKKFCPFHRILKETLATLPWMLYVTTRRLDAEAGAAGYTLQYNPDSLTVGPTADGQFATYKLVCRVWFAHSHYKADVRDPRDGTFTEWNFETPSPTDMSTMRNDTKSRLLIWQRVE